MLELDPLTQCFTCYMDVDILLISLKSDPHYYTAKFMEQHLGCGFNAIDILQLM